MRARVEIRDGFELVAVAQFLAHEGHSVTVDGTGAGNRHIFNLFSGNPHHPLATVFAEGTLGVDAFVGIGKQARIGFEKQRYVGFQMNRAAHEGLVGGEDHCAAAVLACAVDGFLDSGCIVGGTVACGAERHDIVVGSRAASAEHQRCRGGHENRFKVEFHYVTVLIILIGFDAFPGA